MLARLTHGVLACALVLPFVASAPAAAESARVSMSASSNRVAVGEPFAVEIRVETKGEEVDKLELPDFGELQVLARSTSRPFSFSFGFGSGGQRALVKSEIVHSFTLQAPAAGAYTIRPAVARVGGRRIASQSLSILAVDPGQAGMNAPTPTPVAPDDALAPPTGKLDGAKFDQTMFLRTVVDKKRAYVGEQVTVTVYLYVRGQIGDTPSVTREPTLEGFWSQDLLPMQRSLSATRQEINGRTYSAYVLRRFAAFPLRPGTLEVGAPAIEVGGGGSLFDLLTGPSAPVRREGVKVPVEVVPLPPQPTPNAPTFTGALTLEAALDPAEAEVGDAVTLRVTASGRGNLRALSLATPSVAGLEILPPEIDDAISNDFEQIGGKREFRWLVLPRTPGDFTLPSFQVDVFDPSTEQYTTARSGALKLRVTPSDAGPPPAAAEAAPEDLAGVRFGPVRPTSELRRQTPAVAAQPWFWPLVLLAPLLLLGALSGRAVRARLSRGRVLSRDLLALQQADDKLEQAKAAAQRGDAQAALAQLAGALKRTLEIRLGESVGSMTTRALDARLRARGMDGKLIERAVAQLSALERARFDPGAQGALELTRAIDGVRALTRELARARVSPGPDGPGHDPLSARASAKDSP